MPRNPKTDNILGRRLRECRGTAREAPQGLRRLAARNIQRHRLARVTRRHRAGAGPHGRDRGEGAGGAAGPACHAMPKLNRKTERYAHGTIRPSRDGARFCASIYLAGG